MTWAPISTQHSTEQGTEGTWGKECQRRQDSRTGNTIPSPAGCVTAPGCRGSLSCTQSSPSSPSNPQPCPALPGWELPLTQRWQTLEHFWHYSIGEMVPQAVTQLDHKLACRDCPNISAQYCHQPWQELHENLPMAGDKHSPTESPSTPAFSRIPLRAPGLSKALELMQDRGKNIKRRKCTGAEEPLFVMFPAWGSWPF